jgi:hypothetical protein
LPLAPARVLILLPSPAARRRGRRLPSVRRVAVHAAGGGQGEEAEGQGEEVSDRYRQRVPLSAFVLLLGAAFLYAVWRFAFR